MFFFSRTSETVSIPVAGSYVPSLTEVQTYSFPIERRKVTLPPSLTSAGFFPTTVAPSGTLTITR